MRQPRDQTLKERARALRANQSPIEARLWSHLRAHRFAGHKISRQVVVEPFILDFAARSAKLAIEIDGDTHAGQVEYDARRTAYLEQQGYRVIRFTNAEIMGNIEGVLTAIGIALGERSVSPLASAPLPNPLPGGERGLRS